MSSDLPPQPSPPGGFLLIPEWPGIVEVLLDGQRLAGRPPLRHELSAGWHRVSLRQSDGVVIERSVSVSSGRASWVTP